MKTPGVEWIGMLIGPIGEVKEWRDGSDAPSKGSSSH